MESENRETKEERDADVDAAFQQVMRTGKKLADQGAYEVGLQAVEHFLSKFSVEESAYIILRNAPEWAIVAAQDGLGAADGFQLAQTPDPRFVEFVRQEYENLENNNSESVA